jgi:hypothetical protein
MAVEVEVTNSAHGGQPEARIGAGVVRDGRMEGITVIVARAEFGSPTGTFEGVAIVDLQRPDAPLLCLDTANADLLLRELLRQAPVRPEVPRG